MIGSSASLSLPNDDRPKPLPAGTINAIAEINELDDVSPAALTIGFVIGAAL